MKKRYPLQPLLKLREHRVEQARVELMQRREYAQQCRDACVRIEGEIIALQFERRQQRERLLEAPPPGLCAPQALSQRENHIAHLETLEQAARQRLFQAQDVLRQAELALEQARQAYFRAKSRLEALEKRKGIWRAEQGRLAARLEENAVADVLQARMATARGS